MTNTQIVEELKIEEINSPAFYKKVYINISNWNQSRVMEIVNGKIIISINVDPISLCLKCRNKVERMKARLLKKNIAHKWTEYGPYTFTSMLSDKTRYYVFAVIIDDPNVKNYIIDGYVNYRISNENFKIIKKFIEPILGKKIIISYGCGEPRKY